MKTIRRIYFYLMALISIQVLIWGIIGQIRILFDASMIGNLGEQVSRSLAWTLVALPIFLLHWLTVQRDAGRDLEERNSRVRAFFLYGVLLGLMIPVVQNVLAILSRGLLDLFNQSVSAAWIGGNQNLADNLSAILVNLLGFLYFGRVLQRDWQSGPPSEAWVETRRLQRYVWMLYGLGMMLIGSIRLLDVLLQFITLPHLSGLSNIAANALALTLIGLPLWILWWLRIQRSLGQPEEALSLLRLSILFSLTILSALTILVVGGVLLNQVLLIVLDGQKLNWESLNGVLSLGAVFGVLWFYLRRTLKQAIATIPDGLRAAAVERIYRYLLAAAGCLTVYLGTILTLLEGVERLFASNWLGGSLNSILGPIAMLLIGMPYWLIFWMRSSAEAQQKSELGDHARRSLSRRIYLYAFILISVLSMLGFGGQLAFQLLNQILGEGTENLLSEALKMLSGLLVASTWLGYHILTLRRDNKQALHTLQNRQTNFAVLILHAGDEAFANAVHAALNRLAPSLPVATHDINLGIPDEALSGAQAILLPSSLAIHPSEALRLWLDHFTGQWIIVPQAQPNRAWSGVELRSLNQMAQEAARTAVQLAEGQSIRTAKPISAWAILGYIVLGLIGLQIMLALLSFTMTFID
jgi:hypothetical protein